MRGRYAHNTHAHNKPTQRDNTQQHTLSSSGAKIPQGGVQVRGRYERVRVRVSG